MGCFQQTQKFWKQQFFGPFLSGVTWRGVGNVPGANVPINQLTSSAAGVTLLIDNNSIVWRSINGGRTWANISSALVGHSLNSACNLVSSATGTWLVSFGPSAFRSTDNGVTWAMIATGLVGAGSAGLQTDGAGHWIAFVNAAGANFATSADDGLTWATHPMIGPDPPNDSSTNSPPIWDGTQFALFLFASVPSNLGYVATSTDGIGLTWTVTAVAGTRLMQQMLFNAHTGLYMGLSATNQVTTATTAVGLGSSPLIALRGLDGFNDFLVDGIFAGPDIFALSASGRVWNSFDGNLWAEDRVNLLPGEPFQFNAAIAYDPVNQSYILGGFEGSVSRYPPT
jgi:hypothetical protein